MEKRDYLQQIKAKYSLEKIEQALHSLSSLKVLVIGDTIIDEYCFVQQKGGALKDPMQTVNFSHEERYAGGILAIANHISNFAGEVAVLTLLGDTMDHKEYVLRSLAKKIKPILMVKERSPTTTKRRYINHGYTNEKLFMIEYMNDTPISEHLEQEVISFLQDNLAAYDLVILGDFGHGFINDRIRKFLQAQARYLAINVQTNSANLGFNFITGYSSPSFISMDVPELRFAVGNKHGDVSALVQDLYHKKKYPHFLVTMGAEGVAYFKDGMINRGLALTTNVKDIVGAGDAVFSIVSLLAFQGCPEELIPFFANAVGGVAVQIIGNKESVKKETLLKFIQDIFKETEESEVSSYFHTISKTLGELDKGNVNTFVQQLLETYEKGGVIYVFGNGGSAATASHFCGDLVMGVSCGLQKRFRAICLNDNIPALMAIANDISYDDIFVEQLINFLKPEDLVVGISGSGNSVNVIKAIEFANQQGAKTVAICGYKGGKIKEISQLAVHAPIDDMEITEDIHNLIITHCVKKILKNKLKNNHITGGYVKRLPELHGSPAL